MPKIDRPEVIVRNTQPGDFDAITQLCLTVYPHSQPWTETALASHLKMFPQGQFVAQEKETGRVLGMAASLVILWDDYEIDDNWRDFTDHGLFTNHDSQGHTLYGAEVMVHPESQGMGVGKKIYAARRELARSMALWRIRAGARLRGYGKYQLQMTAKEYVNKIVAGELSDPTLSFQIKQGFRVLAVTHSYIRHDPESDGYAAVIEWLNEEAKR